jgi:hypothetical protein
LKWSLKPFYSQRLEDSRLQDDGGIGGTSALTAKAESDIDDDVKVEDAL